MFPGTLPPMLTSMGAALLLAYALQPPATETDQTPARVQVSDRLKLDVVGFPDYSAELTVASDGTISGRGFGRIQVQNLSLTQAEARIAQNLKRFIANPVVSLAFIEQSSAFVFVIGAPVPEGRVRYTPGLDLRRVFSGLTFQEPSTQQVAVYRDGELIQTVELSDLLETSGTWSGPLRPADMVIVSRRPTLRVWMIGRLKQPGERAVPQGATLAQAIADAGGFELSNAVLNRVVISVRRGPDLFRFPGRLDEEAASFILQAGDTVTVEEPRAVQALVSGEVNSPGRYTLEDGEDLYAAVIAAGGVTSSGTLAEVLVFREGLVRRVDLLDRATAQTYDRFVVKDGDIVIVRQNVDYIYVLGEVARPGRFTIPDNRQVTAAEALALADGLTPRGVLRRVVLARIGTDGAFVSKTFNLDEFIKDGKQEANPILQPGDVILFTQTGGIGLNDLTRAVSAALLFESLTRR